MFLAVSVCNFGDEKLEEDCFCHMFSSPPLAARKEKQTVRVSVLEVAQWSTNKTRRNACFADFQFREEFYKVTLF